MSTNSCETEKLIDGAASTVSTTDFHSDNRDHETNSCVRSCNRELALPSRVLYSLACLAYNCYLVWLISHLRNSPYYWFLILLGCWPLFRLFNLRNPYAAVLCSMSVLFIVMACFTTLTRAAYYHLQPGDFIGPRFVIVSLQASIPLNFMPYFLPREGQMDLLLERKDMLTRALLDFVDIFNMVEVLSANECVGVGSIVSEGSPTEKAIQTFCIISFFIMIYYNECTIFDGLRRGMVSEFSFFLASIFFQNLPFLVIRILIMARYKLYSLGFLVKNLNAIVFSLVALKKKWSTSE